MRKSLAVLIGVIIGSILIVIFTPNLTTLSIQVTAATQIVLAVATIFLVLVTASGFLLMREKLIMLS
jgi:hypothetical protein